MINPLVIMLASLALSYVMAIVAYCGSPEESRWTAIVGASIGMAGAGFTAVSFLSAPGVQAWEILSLRFLIDPFNATLLPAISVGTFALVLNTPNRYATPRHFSILLFMQGACQLALIANNLTVLIFGELLALFAALATFKGLRTQKLARCYLGSASLLLIVAWLCAVVSEVATLSLEELAKNSLSTFCIVPLSLGLAIRMGLPPFSSWFTAAYQEKNLSAVLVGTLPFSGFVTCARVLEPIVSSWGATEPLAISVPILFVGLLCAGLSLVQTSLGRSCAFTLLSANCLVLVGLLDPNPVGFVGGELMWAAVLTSTTGFGMMVNSVLARFSGLTLTSFHGLYQSAPYLGTAFLIMGLSIAGIPGTVDFASEDVLLHGSIGANIGNLALVTMTISVLGFNVVRMFFRVFYGVSPFKRIGIDLQTRELFAVGTIIGLLFLGGIAPSLLPLIGVQGH
ncbi:MAG: proton-conducting transporter membrane subunit [Planctomycetota bacterium]|nr:proton-conducting transporter membrane subunit [Planctomycetota bacterium]